MPILQAAGGPQILRRRGSVTPWYRAGDAPAPLAAYQPKGAASLAASYINLANPGTYNAAPGVAPTWNATDGWIFLAASTQYLTSGIVVDTGYTTIVRFSNVSNTGYLFGAQGTYRYWFAPNPATLKRHYGWSTNQTLQVGTNVTYGVVGYSSRAYYNGVEDSTTDITSIAIPGRPIFIGALNASTASAHISAYVQAVAIWASTLTAPQVAAISTAMAAL